MRGQRALEIAGRGRTGVQRLGQRGGLVRAREGRLVAGVFAGLGRRFGISPWALRGIFLATLLIPGPQFLLYLVLWVALPDESRPV